tara:strand:- start:2 stop:448 length:447 start_codon:yes stop_codon:yes gene_type:complete
MSGTNGANSMVDAENALRTYLLTAEVQARLTGGSGTGIKIFLYEFNSDQENVPKTCIMIRDVGGDGDIYLELDKPLVQIWVRSDSVNTAKTLIGRLDDELQRLGPKAISDDVFCLTMLRNTGKQRLDDPDSQLVQYFIMYNTVMRKIA